VTATNGVDILIGLAVLVFILARQLQVRPVRDNMRLPFILAIIGVIELAQFLSHGHHGPGIVVALAGSLVIAAVGGAIRAATTHVWVDGGRALRQGNWLTAVLWIASLGAHLGYDYLVDGKGSNAGLGSASLLLYLGVTFTIQRLILQARANRIASANPQGTGSYGTGSYGTGSHGPGSHGTGSHGTGSHGTGSHGTDAHTMF
jgi:hypothetical protein